MTKTKSTIYKKRTVSVCRIIIFEDDAIAMEVLNVEDETFDKDRFEYDWKIFEVRLGYLDINNEIYFNN